MATQFKIDSNNNIDCRGIKIKKKWNSETLQFEDSDEFYMYNQGEIKGNYVYCSLPGDLANRTPFPTDGIISKDVGIAYEDGNIEVFEISLLYDNQLQTQIRKTKGDKIDSINYITDPQFEDNKSEQSYYGLIVSAYPQNVEEREEDIYIGKYALRSGEGASNGYYVFGDLTNNGNYFAILNLKKASQLEGYNRENFGEIIIKTAFHQRNHLFFDKTPKGGGGVSLPKMKISISTDNLEGDYQADGEDWLIGQGVGYGTIKVYNGSSNLLDTYEVDNQVFRIKRTSGVTTAFTQLDIYINGNRHSYLFSDYSDLYINCDLVYWNEESSIEISQVS